MIRMFMPVCIIMVNDIDRNEILVRINFDRKISRLYYPLILYLSIYQSTMIFQFQSVFAT